jgi:hypothetical protein
MKLSKSTPKLKPSTGRSIAANLILSKKLTKKADSCSTVESGGCR